MATVKLFVCVMVVAGTVAQVPIPKRETGFIYGNDSMNAPVHFDFYIDQLCPYSKEAWPTIIKLADSYGPKTLKLTTHLFPLPYHRNSFFASKGSHILDKMTMGSETYKWIKVIYDNRDVLVRNATFNLSDEQIVQKYAGIAANMFGLSSAQFTSMMEMSDDIEMATRIGFKYCCTRGVAHTPTFMVNDVVVNGDPTWTVADWRIVIDPLLNMAKVQRSKSANSTCPPGIKVCEYLPKKFECCKDGEFCIPNVGCRC